MAGSVRRTPQGWVADVSINGQRKTALCRTKGDAIARKREILEALLAVQATPHQIEVFTLQQARELSLQVRWEGHTGARTAAIYSQAAVDFFGPQTRLSEISTVAIDRWRQVLLAGGNRPATVNKKVSALRSMFTDAQLRGHLSQLPTFPPQLRMRNTKDRVISDAERDGMIRYLQQAGHPAAADLLVFLLESCARWGEAEKLRAEDVDVQRRRVTFSETKANRTRSVPLTARALDAISPHLSAVGRHRVFPYTFNQFRYLFEKAKAAIGCAEDAALTIHTTRHTCASKLASKGIPLHQLMAYGGWTSLQSVQRYLHLQTDALSACVEALEG